MKFNEMTYTRPDIGALLARCKELAAKAAAAPDGDALVRLYYEQSEAFAEYNTAANLANIHYTCDTRDEYWKAEQDFFDANGPAVTNASVEISRSFLANPHVDALTEKFGTTCVAGMKNAVLGMDDRTVELQQQFNALVSRYQQIYGGALVELDGKHYVDGSIADPIPFLHLLEQGCDKVIVVLTGSEHARPTDYTRLRPLLRQLYAKKYPMLYHAVLHRIARYKEQVHALEQAQREQRALVLRPQVKSIPLFTQNEDKIRAYYQHGCELVDQRWTEITAFLESRTLTQ